MADQRIRHARIALMWALVTACWAAVAVILAIQLHNDFIAFMGGVSVGAALTSAALSYRTIRLLKQLGR